MSINNEFIKETVRAHYIMQLGTYVSELADLSGVQLAYTHHFGNKWYNSAYNIAIEPSQIDELLNTVETYMSNRNRRPCIYVSPATKPANLGKLLETRGYEKVEAEAWMFYDFSQYLKPYTRSAEITILDVKTNAEFEMFAHLYPQALPSSEADLQLQACSNGLKYKSPMVDVRYFVASYDDEPAGMLISLTLGKYNGLYSVTTIEKFRGKGIFRSLMHHVISLAAQNNVRYLLCQTLERTYTENVYKKLGFSTLYVRECYMPAARRG